jgi:hypothetical protein
MSSNRIEIGDEVDVAISDGTGIFQSCIVKYIPQASGDSWVFEYPRGGVLLYVQTFLYIMQKIIINKDKP